MSLLQKDGIFSGVNLVNQLQQTTKTMGESVSNLKDQLVNPLKAVSESVKSGVALVTEADTALINNLNSYRSTAIEGIDTALKNLTGGLLNTSNVSSILSYSDGFKVNTDELLKIASNGLGFNVGSVGNLKSQLGDAFISELESMTGGLSKGLVYNDGTKLGISSNWKLSTGTALIDFLTKNTDGKFGTVVNLAGVNSILNTMLKETVKNGLYDGLSTYSTQYIYTSDYHDALINSITIAVSAGDIKTINKILDIINSEGVATVNYKYPELIENVLRNFSFSDDVTTTDYPELRAVLLKVISLVGGDNWYKTLTSFGYATNLALVNQISDDTKTLLQDTDEFIPLLCCSGIFTDESATEIFPKDFTKAVVFS